MQYSSCGNIQVSILTNPNINNYFLTDFSTLYFSFSHYMRAIEKVFAKSVFSMLRKQNSLTNLNQNLIIKKLKPCEKNPTRNSQYCIKFYIYSYIYIQRESKKSSWPKLRQHLLIENNVYPWFSWIRKIHTDLES